MCPACLTTLVLIAAGSTSVGGLTALAVKKLCTLAVTTISAKLSPSIKEMDHDHDEEA